MPTKKQKPITSAHPVMKKIFSRASHGQIMAERLSKIIGSWNFIVTQTAIIVIWMLINGLVLWLRWDPFPFIFLNLMLSVSAAYAAPIILIAQNRDSERDRLRMINDLSTTRKAEREIEQVQKKLEIIERKLDSLRESRKRSLKR